MEAFITPPDALRLADAQKRTGLIAMAGHTRRFNPSHQWIHQRIKAGDAIWEKLVPPASCHRDQESLPLWLRHTAGCNRLLSKLGRHGLSP